MTPKDYRKQNQISDKKGWAYEKQEGEFIFSVAFLKHGHIYGMTKGLIEAGARLKYVYDDNAERVAKFVEQYPMATPVDSFEKILEDTDTQLIASAAITCERSDIGCRVMESGKIILQIRHPLRH